MHEGEINPYQPVILDAAASEDELRAGVSYRVTHALLYHAESQYLLHWHPGRLLFGSLAMIVISCVGFWWSVRLGTIPFLVTLAVMMTGSSIIYLALVRRAKQHLRQHQRDHGLVHGAVCTVEIDDHELRLTSPTNDYRWPVGSLKVYRTSKGLLLCPEPLFFVFVPKHNDSSREAFDLLRRRAASL